LRLAALLWAGRRCCFNPGRRPPATAPRPRRPDFCHPQKKTANLRRFISGARGCWSRTFACARRILLVLAGSEEDQSRARPNWAALVVASAPCGIARALVSGGGLSDQSSRRVLMLTGSRGGPWQWSVPGARAVIGMGTQIWAIAAGAVVLMIAYHGVRQGRSTIWVDMSPKDPRVGPMPPCPTNRDLGAAVIAGGAGGRPGTDRPFVATAGFLFALMSAAAAVCGALACAEVEAADDRRGRAPGYDWGAHFDPKGGKAHVPNTTATFELGRSAIIT